MTQPKPFSWPRYVATFAAIVVGIVLSIPWFAIGFVKYLEWVGSFR
jgi:hypothetical protein